MRFVRRVDPKLVRRPGAPLARGKVDLRRLVRGTVDPDFRKLVNAFDKLDRGSLSEVQTSEAVPFEPKDYIYKADGTVNDAATAIKLIHKLGRR